MRRLLLVDDDDDVREVLTEFLSAQGFVVVCARDGAEGLRVLRSERADVILLDVDMPVLDGPGMALGILVHDSGLERIPIVLLSGSQHLQQVARKVGTPYFLAKPAQPEAIVRALALAQDAPRPGAGRSPGGRDKET